jgi:hypothetical protein
VGISVKTPTPLKTGLVGVSISQLSRNESFSGQFNCIMMTPHLLALGFWKLSMQVTAAIFRRSVRTVHAAQRWAEGGACDSAENLAPDRFIAGDHHMSRNDPFVVLTKVEITEFENLRDMARRIARTFDPVQDEWTEVRSEGAAFCFESSDAALLFMAHCLNEGFQIINIP